MQRQEHPAKDVLAGDAVPQVQRLPQQVLLVLDPFRDRRGSAGAGEDRQQRDEVHVGRRMQSIDGGAWIFEILKVCDDLVDRDARTVVGVRDSAANNVARHGEPFYLTKASSATRRRSPRPLECALALKVRLPPGAFSSTSANACRSSPILRDAKGLQQLALEALFAETFS